MAGGGVTLTLQDTFTDTNGVAIQSHTPTPSGGFTWHVYGGSGAIQSNALQSATSGTTMVVGATKATSAGALSFDVTVPASGKFCIGGALEITSATSFLAVVYTNDGGTSYLRVMDIGGG